MASYFLTGESRVYFYPDNAYFTITDVRHRYGAWQVALRYSNLDLSNKDISGGKEHDISFALNWYPKRNIKLGFNYIRAFAHPNFAGKNQKVNIFGLRLQIIFEYPHSVAGETLQLR